MAAQAAIHDKSQRLVFLSAKRNRCNSGATRHATTWRPVAVDGDLKLPDAIALPLMPLGIGKPFIVWRSSERIFRQPNGSNIKIFKYRWLPKIRRGFGPMS